ncbi:MAG: YqgE/AlgH family protein [Holosporales bacterium]|jgi:putative transcriptional regulator|nr:YqgE/AlgH family protein [Holosporales bacterium]
MRTKEHHCENFSGKLLVAMPHIKPHNFAKTLIYVYSHGESGTEGIILNRASVQFRFEDLLVHAGIAVQPMRSPRLHYGGPVDTDRGFVLHSSDYLSEESVLVGENLAVTRTVDVLRMIATRSIPKNYWISVGRTHWPARQLRKEIQENKWLCIEPTLDLIFSEDLETKWVRAFSILDTIPAQFSNLCGHA